MKLFLSVFGSLCLAFAIFDVGTAYIIFADLKALFRDGRMSGQVSFDSVSQIWTRYFPSGMHATRMFLDANLPAFSTQMLDWVGKQTAYLFFGALGTFTLLANWIGTQFRRKA